AEIEIGLFSRQCLGKRRIASIAELIQQTDAWNQCTNHAKTTIDWKFMRKKARLKLKYKLMRS
ncbi:MAG: IS630 family transposase, partial [Edaphobacter sp.]